MEKTLKQQPSNLLKVVLFGPESSGKTTLSKQLANHYDTVWVEEYARPYLQKVWNEEQRICELKDILPIAYGQIKLENEMSKKAKQVLICDTDLLETQVYSEEYYDGEVPEKLQQAVKENHYDLYLLTYIDTPWVADDLRDRPNQREQMFNAFKKALTRFKKPYILIKGDQETRFNEAVRIIDELIASKKNEEFG